MNSDDYYYGVYVPYIERTDPIIELTQIIVSVLSMLITLSVVFILLYRYNKLVSGKSFMHYILMISICDTFVAFSYALGYPSGITCNIQGFIQIYFTRFSWFWTLLLVSQLTSFVLRRKHICSIYQAHYILWPINIILQFIVFSNSTIYGNATTGYDICNFNNKRNVLDGVIWSKYVVDFLLQACLCLVLFFSSITIIYSLYVQVYNPMNAWIAPIVYEAWSIIVLYPISMLLTYAPVILYDYHSDGTLLKTGREPKHFVIVSNSLQILIPLYGPFLALIFYCKTEDARYEYRKIFRKILRYCRCTSISNKEDNDDIELRTSSIITIETTDNAINIV